MSDVANLMMSSMKVMLFIFGVIFILIGFAEPFTWFPVILGGVMVFVSVIKFIGRLLEGVAEILGDI